MQRIHESNKSPAPARKLPATGTATLRWKGREIPMIRERNGVWRLRSRAKDFPVDLGLGTSDLATARIKGRDLLDRGAVGQPARGTLEEVATIYLRIPKKCSDDTAAGNISRLRTIVATACDGAGLESVKVSRLPALWHLYVARRQGREVADYSRRARDNPGINSALRQAASIFRKQLHVHYRGAGVTLPHDCAHIEYLPAITLRPSAVDDPALCAAWEKLADTDRDMWLAIGLARFAGLRQGEILNCRGKWFFQKGSALFVQLEDRYEDDALTKTGRSYSAMVMHPALAEYLQAVESDRLVIDRPEAPRWLGREPQKWLRPFVGGAGKPLHRLRGLYADHVRRETEAAILARQAGLKAASEALGHTTTATTEKHYTTPD